MAQETPSSYSFTLGKQTLQMNFGTTQEDRARLRALKENSGHADHMLTYSMPEETNVKAALLGVRLKGTTLGLSFTPAGILLEEEQVDRMIGHTYLAFHKNGGKGKKPLYVGLEELQDGSDLLINNEPATKWTLGRFRSALTAEFVKPETYLFEQNPAKHALIIRNDQ